MNPLPDPIRVESTTFGPHFLEMRREWGQTQELFYILLVLMGLDIALGLLASIRAQRINSSASFNGFRKKGAMVLMTVALAALDPIVPNINLSYAMTVFFLGTEALSLTENAAALGLPIPSAITDVLVKLREPTPQPVEVKGIVSVSQHPGTAPTRVVSTTTEPVHVIADAHGDPSANTVEAAKKLP